jgi:hypothetical protein
MWGAPKSHSTFRARSHELSRGGSRSKAEAISQRLNSLVMFCWGNSRSCLNSGNFRSWAAKSYFAFACEPWWKFSISAPNPMRPSPKGSFRTCITRARQRISCAAFPVISAGISSVTSNGIPTCNGPDEAKKNPPREIFRASVKCSDRSAATPSVLYRSATRSG